MINAINTTTGQTAGIRPAKQNGQSFGARIHFGNNLRADIEYIVRKHGAFTENNGQCKIESPAWLKRFCEKFIDESREGDNIVAELDTFGEREHYGLDASFRLTMWHMEPGLFGGRISKTIRDMNTVSCFRSEEEDVSELLSQKNIAETLIEKITESEAKIRKENPHLGEAKTPSLNEKV